MSFLAGGDSKPGLLRASPFPPPSRPEPVRRQVHHEFPTTGRSLAGEGCDGIGSRAASHRPAPSWNQCDDGRQTGAGVSRLRASVSGPPGLSLAWGVNQTRTRLWLPSRVE